MIRSEFLQLIGAAIASLFVGFLPKEEPVLLESPSTESVPFHGWREDFAMDVWISPDGTRWTLEELEALRAEFHVKPILESRP